MSSYNKYIISGVSTLLLPLSKMVLPKLIGLLNKRSEAPENDFEEKKALLSRKGLSLNGNYFRKTDKKTV